MLPSIYDSLSLGQGARDGLVVRGVAWVKQLGQPGRTEKQGFLGPRILFLCGEIEHQISLEEGSGGVVDGDELVIRVLCDRVERDLTRGMRP